jgi:hypothetical protein
LNNNFVKQIIQYIACVRPKNKWNSNIVVAHSDDSEERQLPMTGGSGEGGIGGPEWLVIN